MKKTLFAFSVLFFLQGCVTTSNQISAHEHFVTCEAQYSSLKDIVSCGTSSRNQICGTNNYCSEVGNRLISKLGVIVKRVDAGEISENEGMLDYYSEIDAYSQMALGERRRRAKAFADAMDDFADSLSPKTTTCNTTGSVFGGTYSGSTTCY